MYCRTVPEPRRVLDYLKGLLPGGAQEGLATGRAGGRRYSLRAAPGVDAIARLTQISHHSRIPDTRMTFVPPGLNFVTRVKFRAHNGTTLLGNEDSLTGMRNAPKLPASDSILTLIGTWWSGYGPAENRHGGNGRRQQRRPGSGGGPGESRHRRGLDDQRQHRRGRQPQRFRSRRTPHPEHHVRHSHNADLSPPSHRRCPAGLDPGPTGSQPVPAGVGHQRSRRSGADPWHQLPGAPGPPQGVCTHPEGITARGFSGLLRALLPSSHQYSRLS